MVDMLEALIVALDSDDTAEVKRLLHRLNQELLKGADAPEEIKDRLNMAFLMADKRRKKLS